MRDAEQRLVRSPHDGRSSAGAYVAHPFRHRPLPVCLRSALRIPRWRSVALKKKKLSTRKALDLAIRILASRGLLDVADSLCVLRRARKRADRNYNEKRRVGRAVAKRRDEGLRLRSTAFQEGGKKPGNPLRKLFTRNCLWDGVEFRTTWERQKFCSDACRAAHWKEKKIA